jgi:hypothetical protein
MIDPEAEVRRYKQATRALIRRAEAYVKKSGKSPEYVSKKMFGHKDRLAAVKKGSSLRPKTLIEASKELDKLEEKSREDRQTAEAVA